ncbi:MAG: radical SAM/SPASM domain-containing protein [archaeon]
MREISKYLGNITIEDAKEEIPKKLPLITRKEKKSYFYFRRKDFKTGSVGNLGYLILEEIDNESNCQQVLERLSKKSKVPYFILADLFMSYLKILQDLDLIKLNIKIDKKIPNKKPKQQFLSAPIQIAILLTNECNLRCSHCGNENRERKENELTEEEWFKFTDECSKMNVFVFNASGGEPFMRKNWYDILNYARKKGIEIGITSNGTLIDEQIAKKLKELDIFIIHLSLDGIEEVHDSFRNQEGVFKKVLNAIKLLKKYNIPFGVTTAISKKNLHNLDQLKEFIKKNKIQSWEVYFAIPIGCMDKKEVLEDKEIIELAEKISQYKNELKDTKIFVGDNLGYHSKYKMQESWNGCQAGLSICAVDSEGNIKGCPIHPNNLIEGNIREKPFSEIWNNKNSFSYNRNPKKLKKHCKKCKFSKTCRAGCKSSMYSQGTDFKYNDLCLYHILKNKLP